MSGQTPVMVNGLPGKMAAEIGRRIVNSEDFELFNHSYTGQEIGIDHFNVSEEEVTLVHPNERDEFLRRVTIPNNLMVVDFVSSGNALPNAQHYCANRMNFLMGTTMSKADRAALEAIVKESGTFALPAPNFAEQIVGFQKVVGQVAKECEEMAKGYTLNGWCSHQSPKKDVSGTWRNVARDFVKMGVRANVDILDAFKVTPGEDARIAIGPGSELYVVRNPETQHGVGVPDAHLKWHGHHSYDFGTMGNDLGVFYAVRAAMADFIEEDSEGVFKDYSLERAGNFAKRISRDGNIIVSCEELEEVVGRGRRLRTEHRVNGGSGYVDGVMNGLRYSRDCIARGEMGVKSVHDMMAARKKAA